MEIRNLQTFVTAAALLNFTQTARELGYSQSNVSTQIRQLEEELDVRLFDRIGRTVALTQQGQELLPYAREIVSQSVRMGNALKEDGELGGILRAGVCESVFDAYFEQCFRSFHRRFPKVRMEVQTGSTAGLLGMLQKNTLDAACLIDRQLSPRDWRCLAECPVRVGIVVSASHRLAGRAALAVEDLRRETFILMEESAPYNLTFYPMFSGTGMDLEERVLLRTESCSMAAKLVSGSDAVSFLPEYAVRKMSDAGKIRFIPLKGYTQQMKVQIAVHRNKVVTPQILGFAETFAEIAGDLPPEHQ